VSAPSAVVPSPLGTPGAAAFADAGAGAGGGPAAGLRLNRTWPRGPGHLLLEYLDPDGGVVPGQWFADPARLRAVATQTGTGADSGTVEVVRPLGVLLQRRGADRRLAALPGVLDDERATLVVHRPERRAVVRRHGPAGTTYVKVWRPGLAPAPTSELPVPTPAVVAADGDAGVVEYARLPGRSLHDVLGDGATTDAEVAGAFAAAATAVRALHAAPAPVPLPVHDARAEAGVVARWLGSALDHGALPAACRKPAAKRFAALRASLAGAVPAGAEVLVHRDLHDKQVLVPAAGDAGMLDLDTLAGGEAALDVANLLVHLELRALQGRCSRSRAVTAAQAFLDAYRPGPAVRARLGVYAAATRLRLACVYAFRPGSEGVVPTLLGGVPAATVV
jgi:hypothetical protein